MRSKTNGNSESQFKGKIPLWEKGGLVYDECKAQGESGESLKGKDVGHGLHTLDSWNVGKEQKAKAN